VSTGCCHPHSQPHLVRVVEGYGSLRIILQLERCEGPSVLTGGRGRGGGRGRDHLDRPVGYDRAAGDGAGYHNAHVTSKISTLRNSRKTMEKGRHNQAETAIGPCHGLRTRHFCLPVPKVSDYRPVGAAGGTSRLVLQVAKKKKL